MFTIKGIVFRTCVWIYFRWCFKTTTNLLKSDVIKIKLKLRLKNVWFCINTQKNISYFKITFQMENHSDYLINNFKFEVVYNFQINKQMIYNDINNSHSS